MAGGGGGHHTHRKLVVHVVLGVGIMADRDPSAAERQNVAA